MEEGVILHTKRLTLRRLRESDFNHLLDHINDRDVANNIINIPFPFSMFNAVMRLSYINAGYQEGTRFIFAMISKEHEQLVGEISLHTKEPGQAECSYWLGKPFRNIGLTTEAIKAICSFGFSEVAYESIFASCKSSNLASIRVLEKAGFRFVKAAGSVHYYSLEKQSK